ncbi:MAG: hypothetical protein FJZ01_02915 [Candidatus Sericytochromatia bacterium]|nr:hypothetical protein [Candidatus Tanganyikabacteria bacterium]
MMKLRIRIPVAFALTLGVAVVGPGTLALAHTYDNSAPAEPDKTVDGAATLTPAEQNGVPGYWVEYTRYTYQDTTTHYHAIDKAIEEIELAYCRKPGSTSDNDADAKDCGHGENTQAAAYDGAISPHGQTMRIPQDRAEFASYLSAATNNYGNGQNGGINQASALAGTRFASVTDQKQFDAAAARMYVFQFAAAASKQAANTVDGMARGAQEFYEMAPAAQMFMQVAAVYKGNLAANASNYNNNTLRALLLRKGFSLAGRANVGNNDVETLGAVAAALDAGIITLDDVINSGAIGNRANYAKAIDMVESGSFALELAKYDKAQIVAGRRGNLNANSGNAGFAAPGKNVDKNPDSLGVYYSLFDYQPKPSRVEQLAQTNSVYRLMLELHDLNGVGRIYGNGEAENFISSMKCFVAMLQDGQRTINDLPKHDQNHMIALDVNKDGVLDDTEVYTGLEKIEKFMLAVAQDAKDQSGGMAPGGMACGKTAAPAPTPAPAAPPPPPTPPKTGY